MHSLLKGGVVTSTTLPQGLLGIRWPIMLRLSAFSPLHGVQSAENRAEGILEAATTGYTRASWQQDDEGGQSMRWLSYLATIVIVALVVVPVAWAQTQDQGQGEGQDQGQGQGVVAVPVPEARSIEIRDNYFEPASATVASGTTLMWINYGQEQHTVTADDGQFDSEVLKPGDIFVVSVEGSGKLTYHCSLHPEMKGSITVGEEVDGGEATTTEEANPALQEPTGVAPTADEETASQGAPTSAEETTTQEEAP